MFRLNLKLCLSVAAIAGMLAMTLSAQAAITFFDDFEAPGADLDALGYTRPAAAHTVGIPVVDPGPNLTPVLLRRQQCY